MEKRRTGKLRRVLRAWDSLAMLVAVTIGAGIFTMPSLIARRLDGLLIILVCWLAVGVVVWIAALIWAELSTRTPSAGGEYTMLKAGLGNGVAVFWGYAQLMLMSTGSAAAVALVGADYLAVFIPLSGDERLAVALGLLAALCGVNLISVVAASRLQQFSTVVKVFALLLLVLAGAMWMLGNFAPPSPTEATMPSAGIEALGWSCMLIFFAYSGWGRITNIGEEVVDVQRSIPIAMSVGLGSIVLIYLLAVATFHGVLGHVGVAASDAVAADVATALLGANGGRVIALVVLISVMGAVCSSILAESRLVYAMARDGALPGQLGRVGLQTGVPWLAVLIYGVWAAIILVLRQNFADIVGGVVFVRFIFYTLIVVTLFRMRKARIGEDHAWRMPGFPILPIVFAVFVLMVIAYRLVYQTDQVWLDLLLVLPALGLTLLTPESCKRSLSRCQCEGIVRNHIVTIPAQQIWVSKRKRLSSRKGANPRAGARRWFPLRCDQRSYTACHW